jgi:hypothetical protein
MPSPSLHITHCKTINSLEGSNQHTNNLTCSGDSPYSKAQLDSKVHRNHFFEYDKNVTLLEFLGNMNQNDVVQESFLLCRLTSCALRLFKVLTE